MNPSTRPVVAGRYGRDPTGLPQGPIALTNLAGVPAANDSYPEPPYEEVPFTVAGPPVDNASLTVHIEWANPATDWDLYVVDADGDLVTSSASGGTTEENAALFDPLPGEYTARIVNYEGGETDDWTNGSATFASATPATPGVKEAWQLTCEDEEGRVRATRSLVIDRGDRVNVGRVCSSAAFAKAKRQSPSYSRRPQWTRLLCAPRPRQPGGFVRPGGTSSLSAQAGVGLDLIPRG